jgi:ATP-dependent Clp protease ATP-binding subunit ClpA
MWERFSASARRAMFGAQEETVKRGDHEVAPAHLLFALLNDPKCAARLVLDRLEVSHARLRIDLERRMPLPPPDPPLEPGLSAGLRGAVELALAEATQIEDRYVGTHALLLALLQQSESPAAATLKGRGVTVERVGEVVGKMKAVAESEREIEPPPSGVVPELRDPRRQAGRPQTWTNAWDHLTSAAHLAILEASYAARQMGRNETEPEHLLFALLRDPNAVAYSSLIRLGATPAELRERLMDEVELEPGPPPVSAGLSEAVNRAMVLAVGEAERWGHGFIGTGHLLVALSRQEDSAAAEMLRQAVGGEELIRDAVAAVEAEVPLGTIHASAPLQTTTGPEAVKAPDSATIFVRTGVRADLRRATPKAVAAIVESGEEARRWGDTYVGTEHLLLALSSQVGTVAATMLQRMELSPEQIRAELERRMTRGAGNAGREIEYTPRARRVIQLAHEQLRDLGRSDLGTGDLLLGLFREGEGLAGRVLHQLCRGRGLPELRELLRQAETEVAPELDVGPPASTAARTGEASEWESSRESQHEGTADSATSAAAADPDTCSAADTKRQALREEIRGLIDSGSSTGDLFARLNRMLQAEFAGMALTDQELRDALTFADQYRSEKPLLNSDPPTGGLPYWQHFTERARRAVEEARLDAERVGAAAVRTEHLLRALLRDPESGAVRALKLLAEVAGRRVDVERLREQARASTQERAEEKPEASGPADLGFLMRRVAVLAQDARVRLRQAQLGTEHLLLGLATETSGGASKLLEEVGASARELARAVGRLHSAASTSAGSQHLTPAIEAVARSTKGPGTAPSMWDRFTTHARRVIYQSAILAGEWGQTEIRAEHLMLALLGEEASSARILQRMNIEAIAVRAQIESHLARPEAALPKAPVLAPRAKRVLDLAYEEQRRLGDTLVGTEHLLVALIREGDGIPARVLMGMGADPERTRLILEALREGVPEAAPPTAAGAVLGRMTEELQRLLLLAQSEAVRSRAETVDTNHLLLAAVREAEGTALQILARLGVAPGAVREAVESRRSPGPGGPGTPPLSAAGERVVRLAIKEFGIDDRPRIGSEHLLLGLIREGESTAAKVLGQFGLTLDAVRDAVAALGDGRGDPSAS